MISFFISMRLLTTERLNQHVYSDKFFVFLSHNLNWNSNFSLYSVAFGFVSRQIALFIGSGEDITIQ